MRFIRYVLVGVVCLAVTVAESMAEPSISNVKPGSASVGKYDVFTVDFNVATTATNLFWPYDLSPPPSIPAEAGVSVDGLFSNDAWATSVTVHAFYYQDYIRHRVEGIDEKQPRSESFESTGQPHWRLRFAPTAAGPWKFKIMVTDATGTTSSEEHTFNCTESANPGFVGVAPRDYRYFQLTSGTVLMTPGINGHLRSSLYADSILKTCGANGVKVVRYWMMGTEFQCPFSGNRTSWYDPGLRSIAGGYKSGDRFSGTLSPGQYSNTTFWQVEGRLYRLTGYLKTDGLMVDSEKGFSVSFGYSGPHSIEYTGSGDWMMFTMDCVPAKTGQGAVFFWNRAVAGTAYYDDLSLRYSEDGGLTWSGENLNRGDYDAQNYIDQIEAYECDLIFESAQRNGVYLKTIISEKQDPALNYISYDGSTAMAPGNANYYSARPTGGAHEHPSRWLQKAWWRYMSARWGAYTSLHSWELLNEGDPLSTSHYDLANAFADYMHALNPRFLCTTSFWHSAPMEFWKTTTCDYLDAHRGAGGLSIYDWTSFPTSAVFSPELILPINSTTKVVDYDVNVFHSGARSLKVIAKEAPTSTFANAIVYSPGEYKVGIDPTHTYTLRYWAKASSVGNVGGDCAWMRPMVSIVWSKHYHENDYISNTDKYANLGTYDWSQLSIHGISPPASANTANISFACTRTLMNGSGTFWVDDVEFIDETTGQNLYVDGGFEGDRIDNDPTLAVKKIGVELASYSSRVKKPWVWGEFGIFADQIYSNPYKGYEYVGGGNGENQELVDDSSGINLKKTNWAQVGPDGANLLFWFTDNLVKKGLWNYFKAFQNFISGVPLGNGYYRDADATTSNQIIRAWGQKDLTNNAAHLWIDNAPYTWKAVVEHNYNPEPWSGTATYAKDSTCGGGAPMHIYKSLQGSNINHSVTDTACWQDMGAFSAANNPPLPPPVNGTITVSGLKDGVYKAEWWDTSTGMITKTEDATCTGGNIVLSVANLVSDTACKIFPPPPVIELRVTVPSSMIVSGQVVPVTVEFTNTGKSVGRNVVVKARVPAQMDYVDGSGESTGAVYDAQEKSVTWVIENLPAGQMGNRSFKGKVK